MNLKDFRFMWQGKSYGYLTEDQRYLLEPIFLKGKENQRALLLLHGFSSSPAVYREIIPLLPQYDAIVCPLLPGHGESIRSFSQVKASEWINATEEAFHTLSQSYEKIDVMGLSLGGLLACHLSQKFPINHLYLLAPALVLKVNAKVILKLVSFFNKIGFHALNNRAGNIYGDKHRELAYARVPFSAITEIVKLMQSFSFKTPDCPTDLFLGAHDEVVNNKVIVTYFENSPHVKIHWLDKSAHVLPLDTDLIQIVQVVKQRWAMQPEEKL